MLELVSSVNLHNQNSNSLKATIPRELVKILDLKDKDHLLWNVATKNDELVITVTKK